MEDDEVDFLGFEVMNDHPPSRRGCESCCVLSTNLVGKKGSMTESRLDDKGRKVVEKDLAVQALWRSL